MNVKDACLKKNTVRRKRMYVCPVKPVIENDSEKELQIYAIKKTGLLSLPLSSSETRL